MTPRFGKIVKERQIKGDKIIIRYLKWEDVKKLQSFVNRLSREDTYVMLSGEKVTLFDEISYVSQSLFQIENYNKIHLVVIHKNKIVGNAEIRPNEKRKSHVGTVTIAIDQRIRGKGIGTLLLQCLIDEARNTNLKIITLSTMGNNLVGRAVYTKIGFTECGVIPKAFLYKGQYVDEIFYYLTLE
jgi:RimJ/RimL family protein N-acetyltransferase